MMAVAAAAGVETPARHLESRRLRAPVVYLGTVSEVRRVGGLEGFDKPGQGRMEAVVKVARVLRAPAGASAAEEAIVRYDSRAPEPEGDGFHALAAGEKVLVFAGSFDKEYPLELWHGAAETVGREIGDLRAYVAAMDGDTLRLHGLTPATRAQQLRFYDAVLAALGK
jgi:hypothetical protein